MSEKISLDSSVFDNYIFVDKYRSLLLRENIIKKRITV